MLCVLLLSCSAHFHLSLALCAVISVTFVLCRIVSISVTGFGDMPSITRFMLLWVFSVLSIFLLAKIDVSTPYIRTGRILTSNALPLRCCGILQFFYTALGVLSDARPNVVYFSNGIIPIQSYFLTKINVFFHHLQYISSYCYLCCIIHIHHNICISLFMFNPTYCDTRSNFITELHYLFINLWSFQPPLPHHQRK